MNKRNFVINFEKEYLNKLVLDEGSCVTLKQCTHHLALHPYHLTNISESLKYILNKGIAKYDKTLDGILLGYQNVKLLSTAGAINTDTCFIHVDISADFFLFKPEVGKSLTGVVNKKSEDHVGCLVYETFNVSLPKPQEEDDWMGSSVEIGQEILFQINFIDLEGRLPYIRATFISITSELDSGISTGEDTKPHKRKSKAKKIKFNYNSEGELQDPEPKKNKTIISYKSEGEEINDSKTKKKKRKNTEKRHSDEISYDDSIEHRTSNTEETCNEPKKKKKKFKKSSEYDLETSYDEPSEIPHTSNVSYESLEHKRKKRKKLKFENDLHEKQNVESKEQETSHKHKKKHKKQ